MAALAERIQRPPSLFASGARALSPAAGDAMRRRDGDLGGGLTLDDAIVGAWEGLAAQLVVACPVCCSALRPHGAPIVGGGRCDDCGATLD